MERTEGEQESPKLSSNMSRGIGRRRVGTSLWSTQKIAQGTGGITNGGRSLFYTAKFLKQSCCLGVEGHRSKSHVGLEEGKGEELRFSSSNAIIVRE